MTSLSNFRLYAKPSFLLGMARVLDITGSLTVFNNSDTPEEADIRALRNDWETIGKDLHKAIENEQKKSESKQSNTKA